MNPIFGSSNKLAVWVGVLTAVILLLSVGSISLTDKEPAAITASESYLPWITRLFVGPHGVLNSEVIRRAWEPNHQSAPLNEVYTGIIWSFSRYLMDDLSAHRLGNILLVGALAGLLFRLMSVEFGFWAGLASVLALLVMPRFFFHAHLATTDVPASAMLMIVTYVFWRNKESARLRYILLLGISAGLALATDLRTVFLLPVLLLWVLLFRPKFYLILRVVLAAVIMLLVCFLVWPWLYYDTSARITAAFQSLGAASVTGMQWYLGRIVNPLPWHSPFVILWAVVPAGTLLLIIVGLARSILSRRARAFGVLLLMIVAIPLGLLASGKFALEDNDRMLILIVPFLAALAGMGFGWLIQGAHFLLRKIHQPGITTVAAIGACILLFILPIYQSILLFPHLLSYYSEQVGWLPGAHAMGLTTTYGCDTCREAVDNVNQAAKEGDTVWVDAESLEAMLYYQEHGILRDNVGLVTSSEEGGLNNEESLPGDIPDFTDADLVILQYRENQLYNDPSQPTPLFQWVASRQPSFRVENQGVVLLDVYQHSE